MSKDSRPLVFAVEKFDDCYLEGEALLRAHWDEIAMFKDLQILDPQLDRYRQLERIGKLVIVTARLADTMQLVGYHVTILDPLLHYKGVLGAVDDVHYLHPDFRAGSNAVRMIRFAEAQATARGAHLSIARAKAKSEHGALYTRLGYELSDEVFLKRLDKE